MQRNELVEAIQSGLKWTDPEGCDGQWSYRPQAEAMVDWLEAQGLAVVQGWQGIESAPRDGTRFAVLIPKPSRRTAWTLGICHWETGMSEPRFIFDNWSTDPQPTHWMPLPASPLRGEG